jgi:hypothetical protein
MTLNLKTASIFWSIFLAITWCAYSVPILELTFKDDDAHVMRVALSYPWYAFLTQPLAYQEVSTAHYMPGVLWSYQFDLWLAPDVNPRIFYIHQWLAVTTLIILITLLARQLVLFLRTLVAVIIFTLLVLNPSIFSLLMENYTRHYVEGGISIILSLMAANTWRRRGKPIWLLVATVFYALSLLYKEIYLIAAFLYLWLPWFRTWRAKDLFISFAAVTLIYIQLRGYMLNTFGGGMKDMDLAELLLIAYNGLPNLFDWFVTNHYAILIVLGISFLTSLLVFIRRFLLYGKLRWDDMPRWKRFFYLLLSCLLILLPALFAPHVWQETASSANRIFILLYIFLALFATVTLVENITSLVLPYFFCISDVEKKSYFIKFSAFLVILTILLRLFQFLHKPIEKVYQSAINEQNSSAQAVITKALLKQPADYDAIFPGTGYLLGELHWVIHQQRGDGIDLLLTYQEVAERYQANQRIGYFEPTCRCMKLMTALPTRCQQWLPENSFNTQFAYQEEKVSWSTDAAKMPGESGIIFLDRHLALPVPIFSARLARVRTGERYRFYYLGEEGKCWLSAVSKG